MAISMRLNTRRRTAVATATRLSRCARNDKVGTRNDKVGTHEGGNVPDDRQGPGFQNDISRS